MQHPPEPEFRQLEYLPLGDLIDSPNNARTHPEEQIAALARAMDAFSYTIPIVIDENNMILGGHARKRAAARRGMATIPCIRLSHMSATEKRAYMLAENQLATQAGWDLEVLATEQKALLEANFDLTIAGFDMGQVDLTIGQSDAADPQSSADADDEVPDSASASVVTQPGDLWILGRHRLLCGNAREPSDVELLMDGAKADMLFTDPPFNVPIHGHVSGLGKLRHREFVEGVGEMSPAQFTEFLERTLSLAAGACRSGAVAFTCMDWRHMGELLHAGSAAFTELKNLCVWNKTNAGMGTFYRSQHELVFVWKIGSDPHLNTFGLGDKGRYRTNVWTYAGANTFRAGRMEDLSLHPTVKPVAMVADAIKDVTHRGHIVLDVFAGSGTTLVAAERVGRQARLLEIDPAYCDIAIRRWEKQTGKSATLLRTGHTFSHTRSLRTGWTTKLTEEAVV